MLYRIRHSLDTQVSLSRIRRQRTLGRDRGPKSADHRRFLRNRPGRLLQAETHTENVRFTSVYMPLVRTDMITPNPLYADAAALTPAQGAQIIADAVIDRPRRLEPLLGRVNSLIDAALPERADALSSARFRTGM